MYIHSRSTTSSKPRRRLLIYSSFALNQTSFLMGVNSCEAPATRQRAAAAASACHHCEAYGGFQRVKSPALLQHRASELVSVPSTWCTDGTWHQLSGEWRVVHGVIDVVCTRILRVTTTLPHCNTQQQHALQRAYREQPSTVASQSIIYCSIVSYMQLLK